MAALSERSKNQQPARLEYTHHCPPSVREQGPKPSKTGQRGSQKSNRPLVRQWMNFYTKVLSKFATQSGLKIGLNVEIAPDGGVSNQKADETMTTVMLLAL